MKKKLVTFMLCFICSIMAVSAKSKLAIDKTIDGVRVVQTERTAHVFSYTQMTDASISLSCVKTENICQYCINVFIFTNNDISKGNKLLLKLDNNEILTLAADTDAETENLMTTQNVFGAITGKTDITHIPYTITIEQLQKIINNKVVKVRVETTLDAFDGKVYGNKFSKTIQEDYSLIQGALSQQKSIYDDF